MHVPSVAGRLHHYVLRTLCAICCPDDHVPHHKDSFKIASATLSDCFAQIVQETPDAVVQAASELLADPVSRRRLQVEFEQAHPLVLIARYFFHDGQHVTTHMAVDDAQRLVPEGPTMDVAPGVYNIPTASKTAFLLEQSRFYPSPASEDGERSSIWQGILLIRELPQ